MTTIECTCRMSFVPIVNMNVCEHYSGVIFTTHVESVFCFHKLFPVYKSYIIHDIHLAFHEYKTDVQSIDYQSSSPL